MHTQDSTHPTGVSDDSPRGGSEVARARTRKAHACIELRKEGESWEDIAKVLGYPTGRAALVAVEAALEKDLKTVESQAFMRKMASERLDLLVRSVWKRAVDDKHPEQFAALDRVRALIGDHVKLHGLAAPTELVVHNPTQQELEKWVATVVTAGVPALEEADIFEAEIIEETSESEDADAAQAE